MPSEDSPVYMLAAARWWASLGMPVFPLAYPIEQSGQLTCSCSKTDCHSPAKHPLTANGFEDATTDPDVIARWWARWPTANIGIRTGIEFDLLDVDGKAGFASLATLTTQLGGEPAAAITVQSGRQGGGRHYYMKPPGKKGLSGGKRGVPAGLDVKGIGGYAVAAPSRHITGNRYTIISQNPTGSVDWDTVYAALTAGKPEAPPAPAASVDPFHQAARPSDVTGDTPYGMTALASMAVEMRSQAPGGRDDLLNSLCVRAGTLIRDEKITRPTAEAMLREAAHAVLDSSFTAAQVEEKLRRSIDDGIAGSYQIKYGPDPRDNHAAPPTFTAEQAAAEPWEAPQALEPERPDFPLDTLGQLAGSVLAVAEHLQAPVDLVAMMTLASISATVRGRATVQVRDTWTEPMNLYVLVIAGAGETKSPVLSHVTAGLREIERRDQDVNGEQVRRYEQRKRVLDGRLSKAEKTAIGATADQQVAEHLADMARREVDALEPVVLPRYLVGDVTAEGLVRLLAEQGGAMASLSAEGGLFDTLAGGRYSSGMANLDAVLQAHDGREPILVDRKGGDPIRVEKPCLTLGLAVQPQVLAQAGESAAAEGRGFLARFLYSYPSSRVGRRLMRNRPSLDQGLVTLRDVMLGVDSLLGAPQGSCEDFEDVSLRGHFTLSSLSVTVLEGYLESLEPRRHPLYGDLSPIGAWANKLDGQIARIAGLLALTRLSLGKTSSKSSEPWTVSVEDVKNACQIADYLIEHADLAHRLWRGQHAVLSTEATQLLDWIRAHGQNEFTVRDAAQALRGRRIFREAGAVHQAATVLASRGHLRAITAEHTGPGRPPSPRYAVNPCELKQ